MHILVAYNRYRQTIQGEQIAINAQIKLLKKKGHQVAVYVEETIASNANVVAKAQAALSAAYNRRIFQNISNQIIHFKPDIVHFHNLFPRLGMSALAACELHRIPTIISLHNFFLSCPIYKHYRNNQICTDCTRTSKFACIRNNCRARFHESLLYAARSTVCNYMGIQHRFDGYIVQSDFAKSLNIEHGIAAQKLHLLRNPMDCLTSTPLHQQLDSYVLFLGRITAEKGIGDIIALAKSSPELQIKVAGGTLASTQQQWPENIEYLGELSPTDARLLLSKAFCLVFSSQWFEMCPLVLLESMRLKVPIIATDVGSIPELVVPNKRGLTYTPGDIARLRKHIQQLKVKLGLRQRLVTAAYHYVTVAHSPETHYNNLMRIYDTVRTQKQAQHAPS